MAMQRMPLTTSTDPESQNGDINFGSQSTNAIYNRYPDGRIYATQRPALRLAQDPDNFTGLSSRGRGVFFWDAVGTFVIVNDSAVEFGYGISIGTIGSGKDPVYFVETSRYLVILDPENNQGWTIETDSPTSVVEITDVDFPPNQTPSLSLAGGGAFLDGYLFVMDTEGTIWNSALDDATSWGILDFINASRESDIGVYLTKHHDNIVAIGSKTTEFFFDAGEPVGSPLGVRRDISYRTGAVDRKSVFVTGDVITMIASDRKSTNGLFEIRAFKLSKKSSFSIDRALSLLGIRLDYDFIVANALIDDHFFTFITAVNDDGSGSWIPIKTLVFDLSSSLWTRFTTEVGDITEFAVVSVADKIFGTERNIEILLTDGSVFEVSGNLNPIDSDASGEYFEATDYLAEQSTTDPGGSEYMLTVGEFEEFNIPMSIVTPEVDFGTDTFKFLHSLWVVGTTITNNDKTSTNTLDISWTDDHYNTFTDPRNMNLNTRRKLTRLGKFRRRAFKLDYDGPNILRMEVLEINAGVSPYA